MITKPALPYPDTELGAEMALQALARPHMALRTKRGPDPFSWIVDVIWLGDDRSATCIVYLPPHALGNGPFGADFETLD